MAKDFMPVEELIGYLQEHRIVSSTYKKMRPRGSPSDPRAVYRDWPGWPTITWGYAHNGHTDLVRNGYCHDGQGAVKDGLCPDCGRQVLEIVGKVAA